jgi:hypothetical protein
MQAWNRLGTASPGSASAMSVSSIGLFLQSAANSFGSVQGSWNASVGATDSLMSAMSASLTNEAKGEAAIANGEALTRTNNQISQIIQNSLNGTTGDSGTGSSSSTGTYKPAKAATGTGNKSVSVTTPLSTLGILKGGSVYVSAGGNTTTYTSTGSDTVGDLLAAINVNQPNSAQVKASLNSRGDIVLTSKNTKDQINVSGVYASNIGFAAGNQTFKPTAASGTPPSTTTSSTSSTTTATPAKANTSLQSSLATNNSSAASFLADSGASGSLVDMLA